ncbi:MAG: hypothetical protein R2764_18035 [Bacteroidales bacterium]
MIDFDEQTDDLIGGLVKKSDLESPSKDFTMNAMREVKYLSTNATNATVNSGLGSLWIWVSLAFLAAIAYLVYYFTGNDSIWIIEKFNPLILPVVERIFGSLKGLFQSFQVSSFTLIIFGVVGILFLADGIVRKLQIRKNIYFSF